MIVSSRRLPWFAANVMLPLAAIAGFTPALAAPCVILLAVAVVACLYDAAGGVRGVRSLGVALPEFLRLTKNIPAILPVTITNAAGQTLAVRIALDQDVKDATVVEGKSQLDWEVTMQTRGDHKIGAVHIETPSPWGLWLARASQPSNCTL